MTTKPLAASRSGDRTVETSPFARWMRRNALQIGVFFIAILIWLVFVIFANGAFLSAPIYNSFMSTTPFFALMALPLTLLVIAKEIDLSFPSIMAWGMVLYSVVFSLTGSAFLGLLACLAAGVVAGWLNGWIVVKVGIPSMVATLGTSFFWAGVVLVLQNGGGRSLVAAKGSALDIALTGRISIGEVQVPMQFVWAIIIAVLMWLVLNRHRFGAHVYLVGDNQESARLMGVNADRVRIVCFVLVGMVAAFAGLVQSLELAYFWPTMGQGGGTLLQTLAAVFLGGTSVFGGTGTIFGTFVGAFIIGSINAGVVAMNISGFWTQLVYGFIIVVSVGLQTVLSRRLR
jgi:simple sugar transport system permease protein